MAGVLNLTAFLRARFVNENGTLTREAAAALSVAEERLGGTTGDIAASSVSVTPTGGISAINVQSALAELDGEKATNASVALKANTADLGSMSTQSASNVAITGGTIALASGSVGYAAGNGGTVAQATSKSTGVTLSKRSGDITLNAAALGADTTVSFTLTNTTIAATDVLILNHVSGGTAGSYTLNAQAGAGSAAINVRNITAGSLSEAIVVRFVLIKGATS